MSFKAPRVAPTTSQTKVTNKTRRNAKKPKRFIGTESPPKENTGVPVPELSTQVIPGMTAQPDQSLLQEEQSLPSDNVLDAGNVREVFAHEAAAVAEVHGVAAMLEANVANEANDAAGEDA